MRRLLLVANPMASSFTASLHRDVVEILGHRFEVTAVWPNGPSDARRQAAAAARDAFDVVAAMGGDGIVHQVVNGITGSETVLGVIPAGTTNVVRRILGLPKRPRPAAEALAASSGRRRFETLAMTTSTGSETSRHVVSFAAGAGFDAEVIRESERAPLRKVGFGAVHYARSALRVARSYRDRQPTIRVTDGHRRSDAVAVVVQVHDQFTYVGSTPLSLTRDATPVAAMFTRVTAPRLAATVARAATGRPVDRGRGVEVWSEFDELELIAEPPAWTEADGELLGRVDRATFSTNAPPLYVADTELS